MNRPFQLFRHVLSVFGFGAGLLTLANCTGITPSDGPRRMTREERVQIIGVLSEQMTRCVAYKGAAPRTGPQIKFTLNRDGTIIGPLKLANQSAEPNFRPFAESVMGAISRCQPYKIPAPLLDTYEEWKNVSMHIDTSEMLEPEQPDAPKALRAPR